MAGAGSPAERHGFTSTNLSCATASSGGSGMIWSRGSRISARAPRRISFNARNGRFESKHAFPYVSRTDWFPFSGFGGRVRRKGQELRKLTRDLDLLRTDVDLIAMMVQRRGAFAPTDVRTEEPHDSESREEGV